MKTETLETLLLDQVMGELRPEVVELLEAHLTHTPEAARQAAGLAATIRLARRATVLNSEALRQPLAVARLQKVQKAMRRRTIAWELTRMAACAALGLILGWQGHLSRGQSVAAMARVAGNPDLPAMVAEREQVPESRTDFWSLANLGAAQQERQSGSSRPGSRYRLHWDSPVKMPQVEENL
jgi:anti-sigma factor RsiW